MLELVNSETHVCSEAVCEIRWALTQFKEQGIKIDKYFEILLGKSYDDFSNKLPTINHRPSIIHNENIGKEVKIAFSSKEKGDSEHTVQLGPGVAYINITNLTDIGKFIDLCIFVKNTLTKNHPQLNEFIITSKSLKFMYDLELDNNYNWFEVLSSKGIHISLDEKLVSASLKKIPDIANISFKFPLKQIDNPHKPEEKLIVELMEIQMINMQSIHRTEIGLYIDNFERIDSSSDPKEFENWLKSKKEERKLFSL